VEILIWVLIFWFGMLVGFLLKSFLMLRFMEYSGVMLINKEEGKILYSLILEDYPDKLEFKKHILFRVVASEESSDRN
jgi:hypothetical protein